MTNQVRHLLYQAPLRTAFSIRADDGELIRQLKVQYGQDLREEDSSLPCKSVSILREGDGFRVEFENESYLTDAPLRVFSGIVFNHTEYDESVLALHGAAVEWKGRAYLFLAHTSGGKTTLTSYLVACGFGYLSDDCILLDRKTFAVHPAPKPVHLRRGGLRVLEKMGMAPVCEVLSTPPDERNVFMPESVVTSPLPLGEIFFIDRTEEQNYIEALSANEKIERLLQSPITPYPVNGEYLRLLLRLGEKGCRVLHYRDMEYVRDTVQRLASQNLT